MNKTVSFIPTGVAILVFLLPGAVLGQEKPFKSLEGRFSVQMPGEPKYKAQKLPGTNTTQHQFLYESKDGRVAHLVAYQIDANLAGLSKKQKQAVMIEARDAVPKAFTGKLLADKEIDLDGHPGREFKITIPQLKAEYRSRMCIVGDRLYQVVLVGGREITESKEADAFLNSFKLLQEKK